MLWTGSKPIELKDRVLEARVTFVQPGDLLPDFLRSFWQRQVDTAEQETPDFRHPPLPLARIKKVMKSDPEVKVRLKYHSIKID